MTGRRFVGGRCLIDGDLAPAEVAVRDGLIDRVVEPGSFDARDVDGDEVVECHGRIVAPGFIDTQCNGALGHDLTTDPTSLSTVAAALPRWGVTGFCPTVITAPRATRLAAIDAAGVAATGTIGAAMLGLHLEGPAISPARHGIHPSGSISMPDSDEVRRWIDSGVVALVTLAPERYGAAELIELLAAAGVVVSIGHSDASAAIATDAVERGATAVTHLYNAMSPLHHREPGVVGVALTDARLTVGAICDGHHVAPAAIDVAWRCLGDRLMLVTDASAALGAPDGDHRIGVTEIRSVDGAVTDHTGRLAGSALGMDAAVRNLVGYTAATIANALVAASAVPARLLGLDDRGAIEAGRRADLVVLSERLEPTATYVEGRLAWRS